VDLVDLVLEMKLECSWRYLYTIRDVTPDFYTIRDVTPDFYTIRDVTPDCCNFPKSPAWREYKVKLSRYSPWRHMGGEEV
jgi:hypothetical protein